MTVINRALIVDDHSLYRRGLYILLQDHFSCLDIVEASSFGEAEDCMSGSPAFDLALFDLAMPGMERPMSLAPLRSMHPHSKIAIVAASESKDDILEAVAAGLSGFIPKSLSSEEFIGAIKLILEGQIYVPGRMMRYEPEWHAVANPPLSAEQHAMALVALTPRQKIVLECIRKGMSNKEISDQLGISVGTVKIHVATLLAVLKVSNRVQLALT
jgi:DNA-binding NarL/FixJ family response regulator